MVLFSGIVGSTVRAGKEISAALKAAGGAKTSCSIPPRSHSMADLPSGTVTFLFTDIEGSTARWERDPLGMQACLERHGTLLGEVIGGHGGRVFKTVGDGMYAAFSGAAVAVEAALAAQRALIAEPWGEGARLLVRMALHTGVAHPRDGDYVGPPLNRAARLLAAGHGGQILVSATTRDLVHDGLPTGIALLDLGEHRLKDIVQAERIYQLAAPDLRREFPPLATLERRLHNLPLPRTPLVGRKDELAAASVLLLAGTTGLLTLTGSPGSGKTRLAVHLASEVAGSFPDGVFFAALAPVRDPAALPGSIATALGVRPDATQLPYEAVVEHLRQKQLLLVLDNFEQLLAAAPTIASLLEACPKLKVLATSRAALRIRDEREFPVSPLPLLDPESLPWPAEVGRYPAVELFIQRARAVRPEFNLDHATAGTTHLQAPGRAPPGHRARRLPDPAPDPHRDSVSAGAPLGPAHRRGPRPSGSPAYAARSDRLEP